MTTPQSFPDGFRWGVAAASYQIEGAVDEDGRGPSIWDTFSHTPGRTHNGDNGDVAIDHYHRFREDVALMAALGVNAYRFSIAWSRILPAGVGNVNPAGVAFYRQLCEELLAAGITPVATLYHWDLPQALQDMGGWLDARSITWFAEYAKVAKSHLGDLISVWSTLNEPWCSSFLGHTAGEHAPGLKDPASGFVAAHNLLVAHHRAMVELRTTSPRPEDELGIVLNLIPAWPQTDSEEDRMAAAAVDTVGNRLFADAVFYGRYPDEILEHHARFRVDDVIDLDELAAARTDLDYLGVNYYNVNHTSHQTGAPSPGGWPGADGAVIARPPGNLTEMGWGVEPEGLTWMLSRIAKEYPPVPLMVCENGAAYPDIVGPDGVVDDPERIAFIRDHIGAIGDAIEAGVEVTGYFVWSIFDNFEWSRGYEKRFGLIRVDYETLERTIKASGHWYRDFIATRH